MKSNQYYEVIDGTTVYYEDYVKQLQQEIKDLKETLKGTTHCYDEEEHKRLNDILSKFENWLEEGKTLENWKYGDMYFGEFCDVALDKLQELKEGKK